MHKILDVGAALGLEALAARFVCVAHFVVNSHFLSIRRHIMQFKTRRDFILKKI